MDLNELKDKLFSNVSRGVDSGKGIATTAADKVKSVARIAKLRMEISTEKENLKKTYVEMGKLYYDTHKDDPEGFFIQLCDEVSLAEKNIAEKEAEIEALSAEPEEPDVSVEFEEVVAGEENAAAEAVDEAAETVDEAAEEVKEAVQEAVEEAADAVSDAAEEIKKAVEDTIKDTAEE